MDIQNCYPANDTFSSHKKKKISWHSYACLAGLAFILKNNTAQDNTSIIKRGIFVQDTKTNTSLRSALHSDTKGAKPSKHTAEHTIPSPSLKKKDSGHFPLLGFILVAVFAITGITEN
ncbi:hypothetical protein AX774_g5230 [Zancudomyces culisetae]|uniref:Uncharacterized protein n=1 Tax=Zancudomyces culisetae TaxID=1213189 RepID=A0A1R1PK47_ZANCU|nr:hypothetical protein AX774_g5230 [Zancudomyces culisetae]|eukprot:OMH81317.1 hypothetical protein AX774_g5230 [Zancudomyces culisetae]